MQVFEERAKLKNPNKNLPMQSREPTNSSHFVKVTDKEKLIVSKKMTIF